MFDQIKEELEKRKGIEGMMRDLETRIKRTVTELQEHEPEYKPPFDKLDVSEMTRGEQIQFYDLSIIDKQQEMKANEEEVKGNFSTLPLTLKECQTSDLVSLIRYHQSFNLKTLNKWKNHIIEYLQRNNIDGMVFAGIKRKQFAEDLVKENNGNKKITASAIKTWHKLTKYRFHAFASSSKSAVPPPPPGPPIGPSPKSPKPVNIRPREIEEVDDETKEKAFMTVLAIGTKNR